MIAKIPKNGLQIIVVNYESAWRLEKELMAFKAEYTLLLTGTLITNREIDVFSQYRFLDPNVFGMSFYSFRNHYFYMSGYGNHTPVFKKNLLDDFLKKMHSIAFRTTKKECLDLPEITEEIRTVELEPKAMKIYKDLEEESYTALKNGEVTAPNILTKLLRLSQVTGGHLTDDEKDTHQISTVKLSALEDIIDAADAENQKIVVMARFVPELNDIQAMLEKKHIDYAVVRGGVKDRAEEVRRFQEDPNCTVFVGQIAGGMRISGGRRSKTDAPVSFAKSRNERWGYLKIKNEKSVDKF